MKPAHPAACLFLALPFLALSIQVIAQQSIRNNKNKERVMSETQKNKETVEYLYEECLNKKDLKAARQLIDESYSGLKGTQGPDAFVGPLKELLGAFPDGGWDIDTLTGEGDRIVVQQKFHGTHTGTFQGIPATGKAVTTEGISIYRLRNGKITGAHLLTDRLGFLQQLGILPADQKVLIANGKRNGTVRFIDRFLVPAAAWAAFAERMEHNRSLIRTLPGFIDDAVYTDTDEQGNLVCITIACWENADALNKAKMQIEAAYREEGFDPGAMMQALHITGERGVYTEWKGH